MHQLETIAAALVTLTAIVPCARSEEMPLRGVVIRRLCPGGRGEIAGLVPGDVIASCDGKDVAHPFQLKQILSDGVETKLTVKLDVYRDGRTLALDIVPGVPDFRCERHFHGYAAFLAGPRADVRWNDHVQAGYDAMEKECYREATRHFQLAFNAGLRGDGDVLRDAARASIAGLQGSRSYPYAKAACDLDPRDQDAARVLYRACLMSDRFEEAANLLLWLPEHEGPVSFVRKREVELETIRKAVESRKAFLEEGGDPERLADPLTGERTRTDILRGSAETVDRGVLDAWWGGNLFHVGGVARLRDFVYTVPFKCDELPPDEDGRTLVACVDNEENKNVFVLGLDERGRLLLGHSWCEAIGPCEPAMPMPGWNTLRIVRQGARIDGYVNGSYVASTYVPADMKARLYIGFHNGGYRFGGVRIRTPEGQ
ncbi:MAG: hypothetical protein ACYS9X_21380 [Planctomycetota bacterium]|jgi:hypothetical protein